MKKKAVSEVFTNTRELVNFINKEEISREDIVSILPMNGQLFLVYYK